MDTSQHPRYLLARLAVLALCVLALFAAACRTAKRPAEPFGADWREASATAAMGLAGPLAQRRHDAIVAAEEEARKTLRASFREVEVQPGRTVLDAMASDSYIWAKVMETLNAARSRQTQWRSDGVVEIRLRVDLNHIRRICLGAPKAELE